MWPADPALTAQSSPVVRSEVECEVGLRDPVGVDGPLLPPPLAADGGRVLPGHGLARVEGRLEVRDVLAQLEA